MKNVLTISQDDMEKFNSLILKLDEALNGYSIDEIIPALSSMLCTAGIHYEVDKKTLISFVACCADDLYDQKRPCDH